MSPHYKYHKVNASAIGETEEANKTILLFQKHFFQRRSTSTYTYFSSRCKANGVRSKFIKLNGIIYLRHVQVFMMLAVLSVAYILRVNFSVAIVAMTNRKSANPDFSEFSWTEEEKSQILSSFFWGYMMFQIIFGNVAEKYGIKIILSVTMSLCSLFTLVVPYFAHNGGYFAMCILRLIQGALQGAFFPCVTVLLSKWIPPEERNRAFPVALSGSAVGTLIGLPLAGTLSAGVGGWPSVFYITSITGFVWVLVWSFVGADTPAQHKYISNAELEYLESVLVSQNNNKKIIKTPWRKIIISKPLWAIFISHMGQNWGFWTLLTEMPSYVNSVLGFNIKSNGFLSSLPYLVGWLTAMLFPWISNYMRERNVFSVTAERKIWNTIGLWGCALSLLLLAVLKSYNPTVAILLLVIGVGLNSGAYIGFLSNHVALSPNHCGTLFGITNSLANITSILGPLCVGWMVKDSSSEPQWKMVFLVSSIVMFVSNLIYILLGSSEIQEWNEPRLDPGEEIEKKSINF